MGSLEPMAEMCRKYSEICSICKTCYLHIISYSFYCAYNNMQNMQILHTALLFCTLFCIFVHIVAVYHSILKDTFYIFCILQYAILNSISSQVSSANSGPVSRGILSNDVIWGLSHTLFLNYFLLCHNYF